MRRRGTRPDEALSRYRNALVSGATPAELAELAAALDPAIVETLHQMRSNRQADAARARPDFANGLERDLLAAFARTPVTAEPLVPPPHASANGHSREAIPPRIAMPPREMRRPWTATHLALAAVLALALIGGALLARTFIHSSSTIVLDAANGPKVDTLVDGTIDGAPSDWTPLTVEHWTFPPGPATLNISALNGPQWLVAESGPVAVTIDGVEETVPANAGIVVPTGSTLGVRNPGPTDLSLYRGVAASGFVLEDYDRGIVTKDTALDTEAHEALPPGKSRIIFERLTLLAGTTLLLEPASGQDWLDVVSGQLGMTLLGDGLPLNWQSGHEREVADGELLPALVPGTRVSLRNLGDDPLVLLRLRVIPVADANATESSVSRGSGPTPVSAMAALLEGPR